MTDHIIRVAVVNGQTFVMEGDITPQEFLDRALVPAYPALRGGTWTESVQTFNGQTERHYNFVAREGNKG